MKNRVVDSLTGRLAAICWLGLLPRYSFAGDMDAVGYGIIAIAVGACAVIALSVFLLWAARFVRNRRLRIYLRFLLLVFVYTPVPIVSYYDHVGFVPAISAWFTPTNYWPKDGIFSHPIALAYACVICLMLPALIIWFYASERDRFTRATASNHRVSAAAIASTDKVDTPQSQ